MPRILRRIPKGVPMANYSDGRPLEKSADPGIDGCYMCPLCTKTGGYIYPSWECRHPDAPKGLDADRYPDAPEGLGEHPGKGDTPPRSDMPEKCPLRHGQFPLRAAAHLRQYGGGNR